jgi:hypothetical protein
MEVFAPATTRGHSNYQVKVKVKIVTTDCQSGSLSWDRAPIWDLRPDLYYCMIFACFFKWDVLSDERTGLSLARVTDSCNKSVVCILIYRLHIIKYIYNIYKASVSSGSVQQIIPLKSSGRFAS